MTRSGNSRVYKSSSDYTRKTKLRKRQKGKCTKSKTSLYKLSKRNRILPNIMRKVRILQKHIAHQPLLRTPNLAGHDTRHAVALEIVLVHGDEQQVPGVNHKRRTAHRERNLSVGSARNREPALTVRLGTRNLRMQSSSIRSRRNNERSTRIKNRSASREPKIFPTHRRSKRHLPEPILVHIRNRHERRRVDLRLVNSAKRDLAVVLPVRETRDLVARDRGLDETGFGERLGGSVDFLVRERALGKTDKSIERRIVGRELDGFDRGGTEGVGGELETGDDDVVGDDVSGDLACSVGDLESLAEALEGARGGGAEESVVAASAAGLGFACFAANPHVCRARVHQHAKVTRGSAELQGREVSDVVGSENNVKTRWNEAQRSELTRCRAR